MLKIINTIGNIKLDITSTYWASSRIGKAGVDFSLTSGGGGGNGNEGTGIEIGDGVFDADFGMWAPN